LRRALERNVDWIRAHIPALASNSPTGDRDIQAYIDWIYDRLKDRIQPDLDSSEIDRLVRVGRADFAMSWRR
jgi:hypothetical protein